jgi:hypothetical protein
MHVYTIRAKITLNPTRQHKLSQKVRGEHPLYVHTREKRKFLPLEEPSDTEFSHRLGSRAG